MPNCILCDRPIPTPQTQHKRGKDLVCAVCNGDILKEPTDPAEGDDGQPEITAAILKRINALEARSKELYEIIETDPEYCGKSEEMVSNLPKIIQAYVMTPVKSYKMMQFLIAITKGEYVDSIIKEGSDLRLARALKMSIENEDYQKSAAIRDKIKERAEKKPKTKKK